MKKIPCLFVRDFSDKRRPVITREVTPGCEWVTAGEGSASRKWDGTATMVKDGVLFKRYDCKAGKTPPTNGISCQEPDLVTGHWPHWVPVIHGAAENRWFREAWSFTDNLPDGTYELIGPRIGGNPEKASEHVFRKHGDEPIDVARTFDAIRDYLADRAIEGIVFAHPDGRMCKIRRDDFGLAWPV